MVIFLVATTDRLFQAIVSNNLTTKFLKEVFIPHVSARSIKFPTVKETMFKAVSQTQLNYRHSLLSVGQAGGIHGGDRLTWIIMENEDNFKYLQSVDWQFHVYGQATPSLRMLAHNSGITLHECAWTADLEKLGVPMHSNFSG